MTRKSPIQSSRPRNTSSVHCLTVIMRTHFVLLSFCTICVTVTCFEITLLAEKDDNKNELQRLRLSNTLMYPGVDTKEDDGDVIDGQKYLFFAVFFFKQWLNI